jgi:hypothetical protein
MTTDLPIEQRKDILQDEINKYIRRGFTVVSQTDTSAQLIKAKRFSLFWALFWLILGIGVGLVIYIFWYMAKRDKATYITVDGQGRIQRR